MITNGCLRLPPLSPTSRDATICSLYVKRQSCPLAARRRACLHAGSHPCAGLSPQQPPPYIPQSSGGGPCSVFVFLSMNKGSREGKKRLKRKHVTFLQRAATTGRMEFFSASSNFTRSGWCFKQEVIAYSYVSTYRPVDSRVTASPARGCKSGSGSQAARENSENKVRIFSNL